MMFPFVSCIFDCPVHPRDPTVLPRMVWQGQPMLDTMSLANQIQPQSAEPCSFPGMGTLGVLNAIDCPGHVDAIGHELEAPRRERPCRWKPRYREERVECRSDGCKALPPSSSTCRMCRRDATTIASVSSLRTIDRVSFDPVLRSPTVCSLRHLATVVELTPRARSKPAIEACYR